MPIESKLQKGIMLLGRIKRLAEMYLDDNDMHNFIRHAFRYNNVRASVFPGEKLQGPGDLLNDILETRAFNSKF